MQRILIIALSCLVSLSALLYWQMDRKSAQVRLLASTLDDQQKISAHLRETIQRQHALIEEVRDIDHKATQELADAQAENARLAAAVAAGTQRLRIAASCPDTRVPGTTTATGVDDAKTAELAASARQDYHALRQQLTTTEHALAGLQEYVARVCNGQ